MLEASAEVLTLSTMIPLVPPVAVYPPSPAVNGERVDIKVIKLIGCKAAIEELSATIAVRAAIHLSLRQNLESPGSSV